MKNKTALIFGATGQDGYYLQKLLKTQQVDVITSSREKGDFVGDVGNGDFVQKVITATKPDYVFHLAANSTTRHNVLFENHATISTGTLNILENIRLHSPTTKIFLSGSAVQFKNDGLPINEQTPFAANSPYAISRIQSVYAARYYRKVFNLQVYVGYFFNHDSPLRPEQHVNQKIVKAVHQIAKGAKEKLTLGNIEVKKEFMFAGDMMEAVWILVNQPHVFEAVLGSGKAYSIKDWLIGCFEMAGLNWEEHVVIEKDFIPEYSILVSDPALIKSLGWDAKTSFDQLVKMMMNEQQ